MNTPFTCLRAGIAVLALSTTTALAQSPAWTQVPSPNPGTATTMIRGIAGASSNQIWAVGTYQTSPPGLFQYRAENLILRWNGAGWTQFSVPNPGQNSGDLWDVSAAGPNDVWAVGEYGIAGGGALAQIWHWNGTDWQLQDLSHLPGYIQSLWGVKAVSATDVWAVGMMSADSTHVLHYDGTAWRKVQVPRITNFRNRFDAVDAIGPNDAWAVGTWGNINGDFRPLAVHWDGTAWTQAAMPTNIGQGEILNVKMVASNDVWAVADMETGLMALLHWDGTAWSEVPNMGGGGDLAVLSPTDIYAVGNEISHYDGTGWTIVDTLNYLPHAVLGDAVKLPNGEIWAAGRTVDDRSVFRSLVMRRSATGTDASATAQPALIQPGASSQLNMSISQGGPYAYRWFPGASLSDTTVANPTATPQATTTYTVLATDTAGNSVQRLVRVQVQGAVATRPAHSSLNLVAYPNPAGDAVSVSLNATNSGNAILTLTNALGQEAGRWVRPVEAGGNTIALPLAVPPGAYTLSAQVGGYVQRVRVVRR